MTADDPVTAYARRISSGELPAGKWQRLACDRHLRDLDASLRGDGPWEFKAKPDEPGGKAIRFFGLFKHYKGREWAGLPIKLEPWQQFIVGSLMGWVHRDTGMRRFRNAFIELPRGQGKSTLAGGLLVLLTFFDNEAGAEGYSFATKKDQASITFQAGRQMVLRSPALKEHIEVSKYNLHSLATESKMQALGSDSDTLDGLRPHVAVADEVHRHPSPALIEVMESGMGTRMQPLLFEITTAGEEDTSVYGQHRILSERVLDQTIPLDEWFCFIAAADPEDDWTQEPTWIKANPNWGISVKPDFIRKECKKALANPAEQAKFRRLYLGQKVQALESYFSLDDWKACPELPDEAELLLVPCWMGLDLSSSIDVTSAVLLWKLKDDEWALRPFFWLPADNIEDRGHRDRIPYPLYATQGWLVLTEGNTIDRPRLRRELRELAKKWRCKAICYDPWHAQELVQNLQDQDGLKMLPVPQNFGTLSQPMKDMQSKILQRRIRHDSNPLMTVMVSNVVPRLDEKGNALASKKRSRGRIDGVQASLNAVTQIVQGKEPNIGLFFLGNKS